MAQVNNIKDLYENEDLSLREISRQTGHSFKTVQKYAYQLDWSEDNLPDTEPASYPVLGDFIPVIDEWLEADRKIPRKQRHTVWRIIADESTPLEERDKAVEELEQIASQGDPHAQYIMGLLYRDGGLLVPDAEQARHWLELSAQELPAAQYTLGKLYLSDDPDIHDPAKGLYWLQEAADSGHENAAYRLGKEYLSGENVSKDVTRAATYLRQAAEQANPYAQYLLGKLCLMGEGVPKNKDEAQYWFSVAERNGHTHAGYFLDRMERQEDLPPPNILLSATRLLHHMGNIFRDNAPRPTAPTGIQIDHKRLQRLREKKMAMGHKWNDHENEQNHGMGGMGM